MDIQQAIEKILNYNWGKLQDELPTGQTKYDQRQRSILFSRIDDNDSDGLSQQELQLAFQNDLEIDEIKEQKQAIIRAFKQTLEEIKQTNQNTINQKNFRTFLIYFKQNFELSRIFTAMDTKNDGKIPLSAFQQSIPLFELYGLTIPNPEKTFLEITKSKQKKQFMLNQFFEWSSKQKFNFFTLEVSEKEGQSFKAKKKENAFNEQTNEIVSQKEGTLIEKLENRYKGYYQMMLVRFNKQKEQQDKELNSEKDKLNQQKQQEELLKQQKLKEEQERQRLLKQQELEKLKKQNLLASLVPEQRYDVSRKQFLVDKLEYQKKLKIIKQQQSILLKDSENLLKEDQKKPFIQNNRYSSSPLKQQNKILPNLPNLHELSNKKPRQHSLLSKSYNATPVNPIYGNYSNNNNSKSNKKLFDKFDKFEENIEDLNQRIIEQKQKLKQNIQSNTQSVMSSNQINEFSSPHIHQSTISSYLKDNHNNLNPKKSFLQSPSIHFQSVQTNHVNNDETFLNTSIDQQSSISVMNKSLAPRNFKPIQFVQEMEKEYEKIGKLQTNINNEKHVAQIDDLQHIMNELDEINFKRNEKMENKYYQYLQNTGIQTAFQIVFNNIMNDQVPEEQSVFQYAAGQLREINKNMQI